MKVDTSNLEIWIDPTDVGSVPVYADVISLICWRVAAVFFTLFPTGNHIGAPLFLSASPVVPVKRDVTKETF